MSDRARLYEIVSDLGRYLRHQQATGAPGSVPAPADQRKAFDARQAARKQAKIDRLTGKLHADSSGVEDASPAAGAASRADGGDGLSAGSMSSGDNRRTNARPPAEQPDASPWKSGIGSRPTRRFGGAHAAESPAADSSANPDANRSPDTEQAAISQEDDAPELDYDGRYPEASVAMAPDGHQRPRQASDKSASAPSPGSTDASEMGNADKLAFLDEYLGDCRRCGLCENRTNIVFGTGNPDASLVFVGEAPGYNEDKQAEPFVGKAGQLLDKMIAAMGLQREDVYICNIIKCRPPENRDPHADELRECSPFLRKQLEAIDPAVIVTLGRFAGQYITGHTESLGQLRGQWFDWEGVAVMPTYHPAYLLRSEHQKGKSWSDLQMVMERLELA